MTAVEIHSWDDNRAWGGTWGGEFHRLFLARLKKACPSLDATARKRLARRIVRRECLIIPVADSTAAEPIRHALESIGAAVTIHHEKT